ncbi:uncharacterized protein DUF4396 [Palleronia aestuarii]|uniref:Uncharacterized protein DUF4396 n=1 Tax=Palleronia aestuarii TaxID=568105 RepID=A0A2W7N3H3_9RHOB|nr:DUF4396 domain-containing protein [Palleronia aestuarii]PZX12907.1 uncharacterized protein DUF4396 [Palleronia aestuarii]
MIPYWLHILALISVLGGFVCAAVVALDICAHPQKMRIMNVVWPITGLFAGPIGLLFYFLAGRRATQERGETPHQAELPFFVKVGKGASHCGAGCTLGDILAEWFAVLFPGIVALMGYGTLFSERIFAIWVLDYILAFAIGVVFQYFTIVPMRGLSLLPGLWAAVKADALSLTAWQVGMYGFMAIAHFWIFGRILGVALDPLSFEFWFMMQIAMLCGFATAYPVNWWLIRAGLKEAM